VRVGRRFEPDTKNQQLYNQLYQEVYRKLYKKLRPSYQAIKRITGYPAV
jgi:sugar (pentulose or hexulose) kinase